MVSKFIESSSITLWELYESMKDGTFKQAEWQRGLVWGKQKLSEWYSDLGESFDNDEVIHLEGILTIFTTKENKQQRINDGGNRTLATINYIDKWIKENPDKDISILKKALRKIKAHYHIRYYEFEKDALKAYLKLNRGTLCTPKEMGLGVMCAIVNNFDEIWKIRIDKIHSDLVSNISSLCSKEKNGRIDSHKRYRDSEGMIFRWISQDKELSNYYAGTQNLDRENVTKMIEGKSIKLIESKFGLLLNEITTEKFDEEYKKFTDFCKGKIKDYQYLWNEYRNGQGMLFDIADSNVRWYLHFAIWCRNTNKPHVYLEEFTKKFIQLTKGETTINLEKRHSTSLSNISKAREILKHFGMEQELDKRKYNEKVLIPRGLSRSHINSFAEHGNGPYIIEPLSKNKSRGKISIPYEELSKTPILN